MEDFATAISESIQGLAILIDKIKSIPKLPGGGSGAIFDIDKLFKFTGIAMLRKIFDAAQVGKGDTTAQGLAHLAELESKYAAITLATKKKLTAEELKQLKAKQLKLAIDKANLALGKSDNVFDIEKISLAAAEKNAAEQLGNITSQAQLLQITNDLARLRLKGSILALEEAIASKDVAAITAATNKLNADLKIVGALTGQEVKLRDIEKILKDILPKDLINLANLNEAIRLLGIIGAGTGTVTKNATPILGDPNASPTGIPGSPPVLFPSIYASGGRIDSAGGYNPFNPAMGGMTSGGTPPTTTKIEITVVAPAFTDPNAVAEAINDFLQNARDRGTLVAG
jgi:hypothetical protein